MAGNKKPHGTEEHLRISATAGFMEEAVLGVDLKQGWKEHLLDCLLSTTFLRIDAPQLQVGVTKIIQYVPVSWEWIVIDVIDAAKLVFVLFVPLKQHFWLSSFYWSWLCKHSTPAWLLVWWSFNSLCSVSGSSQESQLFFQKEFNRKYY